jgi:hypothetical protein
MNRAGLLSIVLAAAVTGACGGADSATSSPTSPSSTPPSSSQPQPPPASCVPANLRVGTQGTVVTLQWNSVNGATEYLVLVGTAPSGSDRVSTNTTNISYTWTASPGRQYARVQAKCGGSFGSSSNEVEFTVAG